MAPPPQAKFSDPFFSHTVWGMGSFGIQALAGGALTLWLAWHLGREALGVFSQLYALFVILGQLFVFGLNDSSLKHAAQYRTSPSDLAPVLKTSLLCGLGAGMIGSLLTLILAGPVEFVTESENVGTGMLYLSPAMFLFIVNKVLTGLVNGQQRMRYFAVSQALRGVLLVALTIAISVSGVPLSWFGLAFVGAEAGVLILFAPVAIEALGATVTKDLRQRWIRTHLSFGFRALPHGLLAETFFRVDILVLAIFLSDTEVGLYSFVAFFVEGVFQVPYVVRTVTTPRLVPIMSRRDLTGFIRQALRSAPTSFLTTLLFSIVLVILFPILQDWFPLLKDDRGPMLLYVLLPGLCVYAATAPFESIFLSANRPGLQSLFMASVTATNVILNVALIPKYGIMGAAVATSFSFVASVVMLNGLSFKAFRIHAWEHDK